MNVAFRVDVGFKRGLGHFTRSLSLAERLRKRENGIYFYIPLNAYASELIEKNGYTPIQSRDPDRKLICDLTAQPETVVITDLLYPEQGNLAELKERSLFLVSLDDLGEVRFPSDIVINGSVHRQRYVKEKGSTVLSGSEYVIINKEFSSKRRESPEFNSKKLTVLISLGGSDPNNLTLRVLRILSEIRERFHFHLVIGPYAHRIRELVRFAKEAIRPRRVVVARRDLSEIMAQSDIAIVSGARIAHECAFLGIPMIAVCQAPYQLPVVRAFAKRGCLVNAGCFPHIRSDLLQKKLLEFDGNRPLLRKMSAREREIVDGKGAERIADAIQTVYDAKRKKRGDPSSAPCG